MSDALKPLIGKAADAALTRAQAEEAFGIIMSGEATMAQIGGLLMAMRARGESSSRTASSTLPASKGEPRICVACWSEAV